MGAQGRNVVQSRSLKSKMRGVCGIFVCILALAVVVSLNPHHTVFASERGDGTAEIEAFTSSSEPEVSGYAKDVAAPSVKGNGGSGDIGASPSNGADASAQAAITPFAINSAQNLQDAIDAAGTSPTTITLESDITLSNALSIPVGKDITLRGTYRLVGASGAPTISLAGTLTIDGPTVTHVAGGSGNGVTVASDASLTLLAGSISNNSAANSYGVAVADFGSFVMRGGEVAYNNSSSGGGGVAVAYAGYFALWGGSVHHNSNDGGNGGGVAVSEQGTFILDGGTVSNNSARNGGGVWGAGTSAITFSSGTVANNTASADGGGVFITRHSDLEVKAGMIFSENKAAEIRLLTRIDSAEYSLYQSKIKSSAWTDPLPLGYNNYDINYTPSSGVAATTITSDYGYARPPTARIPITIPNMSTFGDARIVDPVRSGYTFSGWRLNSPDGVELTDGTIISGPTVAYALWVADQATAPGTNDPPTEEPDASASGGTTLPATGDGMVIAVGLVGVLFALGAALLAFSRVWQRRRVA
ncbi:MAG TPA: hypothetical protein DEB24_04845 [Coriobacteriia bacterium]|nr:hypothetical protein [Coriobacteriia bacterium]